MQDYTNQQMIDEKPHITKHNRMMAALARSDQMHTNLSRSPVKQSSSQM